MTTEEFIEGQHLLSILRLHYELGLTTKYPEVRADWEKAKEFVERIEKKLDQKEESYGPIGKG